MADIVSATEREEALAAGRGEQATLDSNLLPEKTPRFIGGAQAGRTGKSTENDRGFIAPEARVLLVDDVMTNLRVAEGLMSPYQMQIDYCTSGADAIAMVVENRYDIVFMDHMMPGMDGREATAIIRAINCGDDYCEKLPIIALSANSMDGVREMFIQMGMSDFLAKPFDAQKLHTILEQWLPKEKQHWYNRKSEAAVRPESVKLDITGINTQTGIALTGGRMDLYQKALAAFYTDGREKLKEIKDALDKQDMPRYTLHVHALKSAAASIGATKLSELAKLLEEAGRNTDILFVVNFTEDLLRRLSSLLHAIEAALPSSPAIGTSEAGEEELRRYLQQLKEALTGMDAMKTEEALTILQAHSWGGDTDEIIRRIARLVLLFSYDEAVELIDRVEKSGS